MNSTIVYKAVRKHGSTYWSYNPCLTTPFLKKQYRQNGWLRQYWVGRWTRPKFPQCPLMAFNTLEAAKEWLIFREDPTLFIFEAAAIVDPHQYPIYSCSTLIGSVIEEWTKANERKLIYREFIFCHKIKLLHIVS